MNGNTRQCTAIVLRNISCSSALVWKNWGFPDILSFCVNDVKSTLRASFAVSLEYVQRSCLYGLTTRTAVFNITFSRAQHPLQAILGAGTIDWGTRGRVKGESWFCTLWWARQYCHWLGIGHPTSQTGGNKSVYGSIQGFFDVAVKSEGLLGYSSCRRFWRGAVAALCWC